ncbi:unnamed protein product [Cylindrotheca closterium]|uniref:SET domain-containing protein n=1 Tax=Cylindrotheca closterium TaxID=2856 RepID=A0AAD2CIW6_9STRA|nr:unnamed protein product [Cylindrotheca closterium]
MISSLVRRRVGSHWRRASPSLHGNGNATIPACRSTCATAVSALMPDNASVPTIRQFSESRRSFHTTSPQQNWWNPFSSGGGSGGANTSGIMSSSKTRGTGDSNDPRQLQERKDATLVLLALTFRRLWLEQGGLASTSLMGAGACDDDCQEKIDREKIIDMAFSELEKEDLDSKTTLQLRQTLQAGLEDQIVEIFQHFAEVDQSLPNPNVALEKEEPVSSADTSGYNPVLVLELENAVDQLANPTPNRAEKGADPKIFLALKRKAIETLMEKQQGNSNEETDQISQDKAVASSEDGVAWVDADAFGYHETIDQEQNQQIRLFQAYNMCRSAQLKAAYGYGIVALQSSLPGAGRGVYVDGFCPAGSIVAFQPGVVWSKEHLVALPIEEERQLEKNDNYQMSLRPDDFMIDSRQSPYTVLTNPWAVGHIINHPTPAHPPNCRSVMVNFTSAMNLKSLNLESYVPNKYAKPRNLTLLGSLWEQDVVDMHGMCLVTTRDVCNEEIYYDYRLMTPHRPSWYQTVQDTAYTNKEAEEAKEPQD